MKAEVRYSEGEMTVSALDSATSLLQAAKNLLSSVILTVKSCYVAACTAGPHKHHQHTSQPPLVWRVRRSQSKHQLEELEEQQEQQQEHLEEEEVEQSLGTAFRGSIRRGNYAYQCKPIFRAQF